MANARIDALYRYPVKGLSPEPLTGARLDAGGHFPFDRLYAIENGPSGFDEDRPSFQPKTKFLMLMKHERLARLLTRYDENSRVLTITLDGEMMLRANLGALDGKRQLEAFMQDFCGNELRGRPRVLEAAGNFRFTDSLRSGFVSLLNLASVEDLSGHAGSRLDPLRFRANIHMRNLDPWRETEMIGQIIAIGPARLKILKTIDRCPATHVDPKTGQRDIDVMGTLRRAQGHIECGIYAEVVAGGYISPDDDIILQS